MTANFTGALRLLTGLGWPMIWVVFASAHRLRGHRERWPAVQLDQEHCAEIVGMTPPVLYFGWIIYKGGIDCWDAAVLVGFYVAYLFVLQRIPPRDHEDLGDVAAVARRILTLDAWPRRLAVAGLFVVGGLLLYVTAAPFLESMKGLALTLGVSQFVFVQWVAPFLSEFPEKTSAFYWARSRGKAGMALMNMVSSNINQWTILAAMIPVVYSISIGHPSRVPLEEHRVELVLTLLQSLLGVVLLANFTLHAYEALGLFGLWLAQFLVPHWREEISFLYGIWLVIELSSAAWRPGRLRAFAVFPALLSGRAAKGRGARPRLSGR
jgi:cation:H+ antiporter